MRLYEQRNNKRSFQCSYCYNEGHTKRHCSVMKEQWDANPELHDLHKISRESMDNATNIDSSMFPSRWQQYYGDSHARSQFVDHHAYMKKRFATTTTAKPKKKRKKPSCGFCGSRNHNRRNCNKLKNFVYVLNETNKGYRSAWYDKFIDGMGLSAGALVAIRTGMYANGIESKVGMITSFPTDDVMFTNLMRNWSDYKTRAKGKVMVDGNSYVLDFSTETFYDPDSEEDPLWGSLYGRWGNIINVVSPAPNRPSKEWFMGQSPCFDWIVKKRDMETLMFNFRWQIRNFYPHDNLKSKLGAKVYDRYYT